MSFNLRSDFILDFKNRWDKRKHIVYEIIDKYDCDIIGVQEVTNKMFNDIKAHKDLKDFRVYKEMKKGLGHALADAIILEPNFGGIGFSFSKMINYFRKK